MSKARIEALNEIKAWLQRNNDVLEVIEENHNNDYDEFFIKDEFGIIQVYISDFVQVVNER